MADAATYLWLVSIRAPARGATRAVNSAMYPIFCFNSRSREGSDKIAMRTHTIATRFNSRSREGSDSLRDGRQPGICGFNSRSREGSDLRFYLLIIYNPVSIRAPARGATKFPDNSCLFRVVSIRAPARGATHYETDDNPAFVVSIRAPARGATIDHQRLF